MKKLLIGLLALGSISAFADINVIGAKRAITTYGGNVNSNCDGKLEQVSLSRIAAIVYTSASDRTGCHLILTGKSVSIGAALGSSIGKNLNIENWDEEAGTAQIVIKD
jgi:hypothetical protein